MSKINIYKSNRNKWLPAVLERVDPSNLPKYFGGTLTDSDGNPKCMEMICWGGLFRRCSIFNDSDIFNGFEISRENTKKSLHQERR